MALTDRSEVLIVHNAAGWSKIQNTWMWKDWATSAGINVDTWDGDLKSALEEMDLTGHDHVWFADARYIPHPSAAYNVIRKKLPDEPNYVVFAAGEPMATQSFYGEKFTAKDDPHDKFGGLRYVKVLSRAKSYVLDETWNGKEVEFVSYRPTRLGFPYAVFMLQSNEPDDLVKEHLYESEKFYPHTLLRKSDLSILDSHKWLAQTSDTEMFLVLDADFKMEDSLTTEELKPWEQDSVHLWYARNPINGLVYGHGGPKAFNKNAFLDLREKTIDVTTSAHSKRLIVHEQCVGVHAFNWGPEPTWRTAFREAAKLVWGRATAATKKELQDCTIRLDRWTSENDLISDAPNAIFGLLGAQAGRKWAQRVNKQVEAQLINDFEWLHKQFLQSEIDTE